MPDTGQHHRCPHTCPKEETQSSPFHPQVNWYLRKAPTPQHSGSRSQVCNGTRSLGWHRPGCCPPALLTLGPFCLPPTAAHWSPPSRKSPGLRPPVGVEGMQMAKPGLSMAGVQEQTFWLTGSKAFAANSPRPLLDHAGGGGQKKGQPLDS